MLREIRFEHFKCFEALTLPIAPLTLLAGVNAAGKSTIVQALALLRQSVVEAELAGSLLLDGGTVSLGTLADVVDKVHGRRSFGLGLAGDGFRVSWTFGSPDGERTAVTLPVQRMRWQGVDVEGGVPLQALLPAGDDGPIAGQVRSLLSRLDHIGAERLGPREIYRLGHRAWHDTVGSQGERAAGALWLNELETVPESLRLEDATPNLRGQFQAWLSRFFPGVLVRVEPISGVNAVTLAFKTSNETDFHRPQHVGYGITHLLPILVAGLRAGPGRVLVVENPEVHLHPAGQAAIGGFLARVATTGATVIVETHSDHVLNGVRRAVRDGILKTPANEVALHFFRERALARQEGVAQVVSPRMDRAGNIDHWPAGFFDQFDLDMNYFAGLG